MCSARVSDNDMSDLCSVCKDKLPLDNDFVNCSFNGCKLHYECAGIKPSTYRTMSGVRRDSYKCRLCRNSATSAGDSGSVVSSEGDADLQTNEPKSLEGVFYKIDNLEKSFKVMFEKHTTSLKNEVSELKLSVEFCTGKIDDFVQEMTALRLKVIEVEKENKSLSEKNSRLEIKVQQLEVEVQQMQQYSRGCNLQLDGVPEMEGERVLDIINKMAIALDETVVLNQDIQAAHRIPGKNNMRPRPIIVQFTNRMKRDAVLKKARAKKLKSTNFVSNVPETFVYVNEHLTPYYKKLLFEAKRIKKEKSYLYVWVRGSKIFAKKDVNSQVIRLESFRDLGKM